MPRCLVKLSSVNDFNEWRETARGLLLSAIPPDDVGWIDPATPPDMLASAEGTILDATITRKVGRVPSRFLKLAQAAVCHTDTCLLYTSPSPRDRTRSRMPSSA